MNKVFTIGVSICMALCAVSSVQAEITVKTELIAENVSFDEMNSTKSNFGFSPGGGRIFWEEYTDDGINLYVDGQLVTDALARDWGNVFSPDGKRVGVIGRDEAEESTKCYAIVDGEKGPLYDRIDTITFSTDGAHYGYVALKGMESAIIIDGKEKKTHDAIVTSSLKFSPDGKKIAYSLARNRKGLVAVNGKEGPVYDNVTDPVFSADGSRMFYMASKGGKWSMVVDGEEQGEFEHWVLQSPFSPDGNTVAFIAKEGGKVCAVINGEKQKAYDGVDNIVYSSDGGHIAHIAKEGDKSFIVVDGQEQEKYDYINYLAFAPEGDSLAYISVDGGKWSMIVDGKGHKAFKEIDVYDERPIFSSDGKRFAYRGKLDNEKKAVVIDGKQRGTYDWAGGFVFSPDSGGFGYVATKGDQTRAVINGKAQSPYSDVQLLTVSPNSRHWVYLATKEEEGVTYLVVDGTEERLEGTMLPYRTGEPAIVFDDSDKVHFFLQRDNGIYRIDAAIE